MKDKANFKRKYFQALPTNFPNEIKLFDESYTKHEDLRYGTNPHQQATLYKKPGTGLDLKLLKTGKGGLSQTNYEDIHHATQILKYFTLPTVVFMKHSNPCGLSSTSPEEDLQETYKRARDADSRAAFGAFVGVNREVDAACAEEIMSTVIEGVVAPSFSEEALHILHNSKHFGRNKHIRLIQLHNLHSLPKYVGDACGYKELKVLFDGWVVVAEPYLTGIRSASDFIRASNTQDASAPLCCTETPTPKEYEDLLCAWYVNISTRSNGIVIVKDKTTLAISTGQQDRVGAVEQALSKALSYARDLRGAVLSSDGFFPFRDSIDCLAGEGIRAVVQPGGSVQDREVIQACNEHKIAMVFTGERCFSHH